MTARRTPLRCSSVKRFGMPGKGVMQLRSRVWYSQPAAVSAARLSVSVR